jgi:hypothetical protein
MMDSVVRQEKECALVAGESRRIEPVKTEKTCYQDNGQDFPGKQTRA